MSSPALSTPVADAAQSLSDRLAALDLSPQEGAALELMLRRAEAVTRPEVEPVVDRGLIPVAVQQAIVAKTARSLGADIDVARRALVDALTYLGASAAAYGVALSPSPKVDEAWHQFILFTVDYARYCELSFGRFIHHVPNSGRTEDSFQEPKALSFVDTYAYLIELGHRLDPELWRSPTVADALAVLHLP